MAVHRALAVWAGDVARRRPGVVRVGYVGSYARGDWGVGSDLDVVLIVRHTEVPFYERAAAFDATTLPVPVDLLVYTEAEWEGAGEAFLQTARLDAVWAYDRARDASCG